MKTVIEQLNIATQLAENYNIEVPLNESITYYQLRLFISILIKQVKDTSTKDMLYDLLKALAKLEIRDVAIPTIRKMSDKSIQVFE